MKIIDGKKIAQRIDLRTKELLQEMKGRFPGLAIVLVGSNKDSKLYVKLKEKLAFKLGINTHTYLFDENSSEKEIMEAIEYLNNDPEVDAILVQLPLPKKFDANKIIAVMDPQKDVDRFHPLNVSILQKTCDHQHVIPPVFAVVLEMLESIDCKLEGKEVCVIANSNIFGNGLACIFRCKKAHVQVLNSKTADLSKSTKNADVLISAVGRPRFIGSEMLKQDAVVIDVGITKIGKKVIGDFDLEKIKGKASFATPVPGGVGPATVSMLLLNTVKLAKDKCKQK